MRQSPRKGAASDSEDDNGHFVGSADKQDTEETAEDEDVNEPPLQDKNCSDLLAADFTHDKQPDVTKPKMQEWLGILNQTKTGNKRDLQARLYKCLLARGPVQK